MLRKSLLLILFVSGLRAQESAYVERHADRLSIGNRYIERVVNISPNDVGTVQIINKLSGKIYKVKDDIFALYVVFTGLGPAPGKEQNGENDGVLTAKDFQFTGYTQSDRPNGGKKLGLNFTFVWEATAFCLKVNYEVDSSRFSMRKWIELSDSSYGIQFLDRIDVESMTFENPQFSDGSFGQPVLNGDIFLGVEYPTVENEITNASVQIGYVVGATIKKEPYSSHTSIIGSSASRSKLEETFMEYVEGIKAEKTRPYLLYNSWYDLRNPAIVPDSAGVMNEQSVLNTIQAFRDRLYSPYGIALDAFVLDDAWDKYESLWGIDSARFPHGFSPFVESLKSMNTRLGLWASPFCGYSNRDLRVNWGAAHGYERTGDFLCFAGTKYKAAFKDMMTGYTREYGVGYFKWDGFLLSCSETDHGHLPGIFSREANVATYIDVMKSVRKINPDIFLNITSGTWLSPWWLKYADCIWMQGEDYGYAESVPSMNDRDKAITYKDVVLWDDYQKLHLLFPISSLMTHGIIKGRFNLLGGAKESLDSFCDEVMMYFGRGVMMWELYISPDILSTEEWNAIASSVKWAKANRSVLEKTKMVLGNPLEKEPYGYAHLTKEKGILVLRNPNAIKQTISLQLAPELGDIDPDVAYYVKVIYPYNFILPEPVKINGRVSVELDGYEVLTAELIPAEKVDQNLPVGVKYSIEDGKLVVFGEAGEKQNIGSTGKRSLGVVQFGKAEGRVEYQAEAQGVNHGLEFSSRSKMVVPRNFTHTKFALLLETEAKLKNETRPDFRIKVNGVSQAISIEEGDGTWFWVTTDIEAGQDSVDCSVTLKNAVKGKISLWMTAEREMASHTMNGVEIHDAAILPAKPCPASVQKEMFAISQFRLQ